MSKRTSTVPRRQLRSQAFERNVFINCPFDEDYFPLLRPLLFTVIFSGFIPRIASERFDSFENRLNKIGALIRESRYSIHDLSRIKAKEAGEFARMNMPFELGMDLGARLFGSRSLNSKKCLILESSRYDFMKALSDLSGVDIKSHRNEPEDVVRAVRDWLVETAGLHHAPPPTAIWYTFAATFTTDFYNDRQSKGFTEKDLDMMPVPEYIDFIRDWVAQKSIGAEV
ncbi:MAG: hypothetical protein BWY06_00925 [Candidatus Latescibacteria bacterium ADurb.Bin168]|nr:MAG: hypothetical protein BWY06_00925 [Candidatus Latescibacteria bacterium ADurb.Bin168]